MVKLQFTRSVWARSLILLQFLRDVNVRDSYGNALLA